MNKPIDQNVDVFGPIISPSGKDEMGKRLWNDWLLPLA